MADQHPPLFSIQLEDAARRFNRRVIFQRLHYRFHSGNIYAITGSNGSGKSTLMLSLSGQASLDSGTIRFQLNQIVLKEDEVYKHVSLIAPYIDVPEEMTLRELFDFHSLFKKPVMEIRAMLERIGLLAHQNKEIRKFSSGMKQRVKLALGFYFDTPLLLLDEPSSHLDTEGKAWFQQELMAFSQNRLIVIASNLPEETILCTESIDIQQYH